MPRNARHLLALVIAACLSAGCSRTDTADTAASSATPDAPAAAATDDPALRSYYDGLVATHGEDIATCPQAESPDAQACADEDVAGLPAAPRRVLLMLDASGSMAGRQGGETKLVIAQDALLDFARRIEGDAQVALRVYGHRGGNREQDKPESCRATELVQPFAPRDPAAFETAVRAFQPSGFTPIAASLQAAARDFADGGANADGNVVYLVSDGIETCDGDPVAAARALQASDIGVVVNVIGFDVDAQAEQQLRSVAEAGGGEYLAAQNRADLNALLNRRLAAISARFNCRIDTAADAFNRAVATHAERYNCLVEKAGREFNAIVAASSADYGAGRATSEQRSYANDRAREKRMAIVEPEKSGRAAAVERASNARDAGVDAAQTDREAATQDARDGDTP
ncbi:VWA domain-containing protein [Luteimonas fraxinea]|uniref:VWA domain-containing protein n=1 Tax=Luteimonas fraxinea TaxID=2901869 RepID=UPI001E5AF50B|nr:VWA domain-containing protein [Luteimonas fraxinea]MCD9125041.1 VWA domain-containing protein [Luteimonas fraxinea]